MEMIAVRSITSAQRGRQLLAKEGIRSSITRTPEQMNRHGCGYSLQIYNNAERAWTILEQAGMILPTSYGMDRQ